MAALNKCAVTSLEEQTSCFSLETSGNCVNYTLMKQQLHSTLQELKSTQAIISLLREDITCAPLYQGNNAVADGCCAGGHVASLFCIVPKNASLASSTEIQMQTTGYDPATQEWKTVSRNINTKSSTLVTVNNKQPYMTTNRFAPLSNLKQRKHAEDDHMCTGGVRYQILDITLVAKRCCPTRRR